MPYIKPVRRTEFDMPIIEIASKILTPGELNYVVSSILAEVLVSQDDSTRLDYATLSAYRAALKDASDEFYQRIMQPYEAGAAEANGDIYGGLISRLTGSDPA